MDYRELEARRGEMIENIRRRRVLQSDGESSVNVDEVLSLHKEHKDVMKQYELVQRQRNAIAAQMAQCADERDARQKLAAEGREFKSAAAQLEKRDAELRDALVGLADGLPNWTHEDAPLDNEVAVRTVGCELDQLPVNLIAVDARLDHAELGALHDMFAWPETAEATGGRFGTLKNGAAMLEMAIVHYAMDRLVRRAEHKFVPLLPPDLVRPRYVAACGFHPRGPHTQVYHVEDRELSLIGTSEIAVAALNADRIIDGATLPQRFASLSHCFRAEAGSVGTEEGGLYRLHQFTKLEMFAIARREQSDAMLAEMLEQQLDIVAELGLHARVIDMPPCELGASAARKFDVEVWMPSKNGYREITSASNCTSYQSRRLNVRYDDPSTGERHFAHTVNGTAVAIPRLIMAIIESFQQPDRSIKVPDCLHPYMFGHERLYPIEQQ
jgi:seryl-tRNA synthetase